MAQVLKENIRKKIIEATKNEVLIKGVENASLREIAKNADMTVGNLYRYFKNKEELIQYIIEPTLYKINQIVVKFSNHQLEVLKNDHTYLIPIEKLALSIPLISKQLSDIVSEHYQEMLIIMSYTDLKERLISWFDSVLPKDSNQFIHKMHVYAFCSGLEYAFKSYPDLNGSLQEMIQSYLQDFVYVLNKKEETL